MLELIRKRRNGVWLPEEGRWSKLEKGQWQPSTKDCKKYGHELPRYGTIPCPLYAKDTFKCGRCGYETPNPAYRAKRAEIFWAKWKKGKTKW